MYYQKKTKLLAGIVILLMPLFTEAQSNFSTKNAKITFFSSTPIEDIKASADNAAAVLIGRTREIVFQVNIKSFEFEKRLMQEHFNENYMESDKYPYGKFKGKINQEIDFSKDGEYNVTSTGILSIHGVDKQRTIPGKLKISNGQVQLTSSFDVACADHRIKIPTLVITKIAEVINVKVNANLNLSSK